MDQLSVLELNALLKFHTNESAWLDADRIAEIAQAMVAARIRETLVTKPKAA
jgi:hypothetical protein